MTAGAMAEGDDGSGGGLGLPARGPRPGADRVEVRVLGPLQVRRVDGTLVSPRDWRTGKTADLLRLLALSGGDVVSVATLVDALWPTVDGTRARASLRTAASHLRKVLGVDSVERRDGGLRLAGAWVDAGAFVALAAEAGRARRGGRGAECVRTTREAEALYVEDLRAHDAAAVWATEWREQLAHDYREMLTDAAEAAVELGWMRDAVDFASRVLARDECSERAYRALMQGYAGVGETERALRAYDRCRSVLAEELGADPAPQTQAVHLQVLRAEPVHVDVAPWTSRDAELRWLADALESVARSGRSLVVRLTGLPGSGRHRLVDEACRRTGLREVSPAAGVAADELLRQVGHEEAAVVVLPESELAGTDAGVELARTLLAGPTPVALVLTADPAQDGAVSGGVLRLPDDLPGELRELTIGPLTAAETASLAAGRLGEGVSPQLTTELMAVCGGNPDRALATLAAWSAAGRIAATAEGLVLAGADDGPAPGDEAQPSPTSAVEPRLASVVDRLGADELEVLALTALLEAPMSTAALADLVTCPVTGDGADRRGALQATIEHLADLGVVTTSGAGVALRDPVLGSAVAAWLRPAVRRRLHLRIAERGRISPAERVRHWSAAGETELACAAAYDAARSAAAEARWAEAHDHVQQVWRLADPAATPADRLGLHELLGDACTALGRREEARTSYGAASDLARAHVPDAVARLSAKLDAGAAATPLRRRTSDHAPHVPHVAPALSPVEGGRDWAAALDEVETVLLPRRELDQARRTAAQATAEATDPGVRARAVLLTHLPELLLGDPRTAMEPLRRAAAEARLAGASAAARPLEQALALAEHETGERSSRVDGPGTDLETPGGAESDAWAWSKVRVLVDRGDLAAAAALEPRLPLPGGRPLVRQLGLLASAELRLATGERDAAVACLDGLLDEALRDGNTLLVPVVAARLVGLVAVDDATAAHDYFDLLDLAVGTGGDLPREQVWRQLARAEVRAAAGAPRAAAASSAIAGAAAEQAGVLPLAARAVARRSTYLRDAGAPVESRLAAAEAARLRARAGLAAIDEVAARSDRVAGPGRARLKMAAMAGELIALSGGLSEAASTAVGFF